MTIKYKFDWKINENSTKVDVNNIDNWKKINWTFIGDSMKINRKYIGNLLGI